ncbi:class I SAM-dependent methyltransferase [Phaeobacter sp.]|uniref:class I SAM-dependent methyltransferase n=1 Tax=Phaeobacter sp. TaxID=1902409 RepID=UPI0025F838AC|nr:class I SAM-dependent methyltransferase [Phaeobacter sp.]
MSARLSLAIETGAFVVPEHGTIAVFQPPADADLSALPKERVVVIQPFAPDHTVWSQRGYNCGAVSVAQQRYAAAIVFLPRAKALARTLIAQAAAATDGQVVVDGSKTNGVDSILKALKRSVDLSAPLAKSHGKIAWFNAQGADLASWEERPSRSPQGYMTAPGVFSADGVDPASDLLIGALPAKLGKTVVDLGAGWGFLSAMMLRDTTIKTLHLVEADHAALACAKENITDERAQFHWADARGWKLAQRVDAVVSNPPFHTGRAAEPSLGQEFIRTSAALLAPAGSLWMVANRHLPYENTLAEAFATVEEVAGDNRFKVLHASRPRKSKR